MRITAPAKGYAGMGPGGVVFADGVADVDLDGMTDDERRAFRAGPLAYYRTAGYGIDGAGPADQAPAPVPADPRDVQDMLVGAPLRDAAVDPHPADYLAPTNAGEPGELGNPHGPTVVSPGIHAATGPVPPLPGLVSGDANEQQDRETEAARRILVDGEPVGDVAGVNPDADRLADRRTNPMPAEVPGSGSAAVAGEQLGAAEPDSGQAPDPGAVELVHPPAHSALKPEWIDHAERLGADRAEAEQLTKAELVKKYDRPAPADR